MGEETLRRCDTCKKPFVDDEGWKRKCLICWKTEAKYELTKSDKAFGAMQEVCNRLEIQANELSNKIATMQAEHDEYKKSAQARRLKATLPPERIMQLIRLSHPDKHGNNELSNEVTKWLLALREASSKG